jgi:hypothetical protein
MSCENLQGCPFYNDRMSMEKGLGSLYKKKYCEGDKTLCARYKVGSTIGKEFVPADLYPNMFDRAEKIIQEHQK